MAKTVDELVLRMTVEGTAQVKDSTTQMNNLDAATKKAGETMKQTQGNVRNVAFQVQDMAVQIAGGTSAFVALGQQIPQLLGGFGVMGAVIGAVAAVTIPLLQVGLRVAGVDMRDLGERTKDATDATQKYKDAQEKNLPTLQGLGNQYGILTDNAKRFFDVQEQLRKQVAFAETQAVVRELTKNIDFMNSEINKGAGLGKLLFGEDFKQGGLMFELRLKTQAHLMGLSTEQAKELAKRIGEIDLNDPKKATDTISQILEYLKGSNTETTNLQRQNEKVIDPLIKINNLLLEQQRNIKESAEQATALNAAMLGIASDYQPRINAARRGFDQVTAARLEGAQKIAEFEKQAGEKTAKDQVNRSAEIAAFRKRTEEDVADKIKDSAKAQYESFRSSFLTNETKIRQLDLESKIIDLKDKGLFASEYNLKYDEAILRNAKEYADTLQNIQEQRRKNQITAQQAAALEKEAADIRNRSNANAGAQRDADVRAKIIKDEMDIAKKSIEQQIADQQRLGDVIRRINDQMIDINFEKSLKGLTPLQKEIARVQESARKAALEAGRTFSAAFDSEDGLTPERAQELADGLAQIAQGYRDIAQAQIESIQNRDSLKEAWDEYKTRALDTSGQLKSSFESFTSGFEDAIINSTSKGKDAFKDFAKSVLSDLARIAIKRAIVFMGTKLFGFAEGGDPPIGVPSIVGEKGPELFVPKQAGTIIPNSAISNGRGVALGSTTVNYNIQAVDAASFRSLVARDPSFIYAVTEQGRRSQPTRSR